MMNCRVKRFTSPALRMHFLQYRRLKSSYIKADAIRRHFVDYFKSAGHSYVRSSPVRPIGDPTLEFVNAGMNQFKNVFLGLSSSPVLRATNSQKCIRVGGKHNDLEVVGHDSYHHTFFEMLGNWSFGSYFKREACEMAWKLITSPPFCLPADRLYVTYFSGDAALSLEPDTETKDIWQSIGVSPDRIVPFGLDANFWEMGLTGPCGPCTEIHYDHIGAAPRAHCVNANLIDLTELWNLVFIQYNREQDGRLTALPNRFVDTGMGFERLVALLQGKSSNYDTDLFAPIFDKIHKLGKVREYRGKFGSEDDGQLDTCYRTLADHSRMTTVAIADHIFPSESHGLRRVVRKTFRLAESIRQNEGLALATELSRAVVQSLEGAYPELGHNSRQVELVLRDEYSLWLDTKKSVGNEWQALVERNAELEVFSDAVGPGLIAALKEIDNISDRPSLDLALVLYDRFGLEEQLIEELLRVKGHSLDSSLFRQRIDVLKMTNKKAQSSSVVSSRDLRDFPPPSPIEDSDKFTYSRSENGQYQIPTISSKLVKILSKNRTLQLGDELRHGSEVKIILDRTNCWTSSTGLSDVGQMKLYDGSDFVGHVDVSSVVRTGSHIVHIGTFKSDSGSCRVGNWKAVTSVDVTNRMALMRNVTGAHLLDHALRIKYAVSLRSFHGTRDGFTMKYSVYDPTVTEAGLILLEHVVTEIAKLDRPLNISKITLPELLADESVHIPTVIDRNFNYFPIIEIPTVSKSGYSREVSFGPNLLRTSDLGEFSLVDVVWNRKQKEVQIKCLVGPLVTAAYQRAEQLIEPLQTLGEAAPEDKLEAALEEVKAAINGKMIPVCFHVELNHLGRNISQLLKIKKDAVTVQKMRDLVQKAKEENRSCLVHFVGEDCKLEKLSKMCSGIPTILFAYNRGHLTGRCSTPPQLGSVTADVWMSAVAEQLGTQPSAYKGLDAKLVCGLKPIKMVKTRLAEIVPRLRDLAEKPLTS